ncbi:MAG: sulfite exporter TauE/SafE family protein [Alcanivoracaceae bacterium]|nr:sulfite exporter TauE/SafE family protein [Alcanivoracaceae bacterium]
MLEILFLFLVLGIVAGLLAGTLGLGGGVVIVPALLMIFPLMDFPVAITAQLAVATSLATIAATSVSAIHTHQGLGAVRWPVALPISTGILAGAFAGAFFASAISSAMLARLFGIFAMLIALQMAFTSGQLANGAHEHLPSRPALALVGSVIGTLSAMFGIGGGSLTVPFLSACGVRMQQAVAISAVCGLPIAIGGGIGFVIAGWHHPHLPAGSLGFVYLPAAAGIVLTSFPLARLGARLAHRLPATTLKRVFAGALFLIGLKLVL